MRIESRLYRPIRGGVNAWNLVNENRKCYSVIVEIINLAECLNLVNENRKRIRSVQLCENAWI